MGYTIEELRKIINSPETSYWLKAACQEMEERDPVDALHEAQFLLTFCKAKLYQVQQSNEKEG